MDTEEKTIELDADATKAIVDQVAKSFEGKFDEQAKAFEAKLADATKPADKEVNKLAGNSEVAEGEVVTEFDKMSKEAFLLDQINAVVSKNYGRLAELNQHALKTLADKQMISKATYMNAGTAADGGALVPSAELLGDVFTLLGDYSSVAADLRTINLTEGNSLDVATLVQDVVVTEVGSEGGNKAVTKPVFGDGDVAVREFAGIAIITKKLLRQAAVDVYGIVRDSFARAIAKKREQLALTDATSGIVNKAGVVAAPTAGALPTWAELRAMPFLVPVEAAKGGKYYISRAALAALDAEEDTTGRNLDLVSADGSTTEGTLKNGYRFAVSEELGGSNPHAVFGNMGRFGILLRQGAVESEVFDSGTVTDGSSVVHNLIQQNKVAQRVAFYENVGFPLPGAFAVTDAA